MHLFIIILKKRLTQDSSSSDSGSVSFLFYSLYNDQYVRLYVRLNNLYNNQYVRLKKKNSLYSRYLISYIVDILEVT